MEPRTNGTCNTPPTTPLSPPKADLSLSICSILETRLHTLSLLSLVNGRCDVTLAEQAGIGCGCANHACFGCSFFPLPPIKTNLQVRYFYRLALLPQFGQSAKTEAHCFSQITSQTKMKQGTFHCLGTAIITLIQPSSLLLLS